MKTVRPTIAQPQLSPGASSWMNTMIASNALISGENASSMTFASGGITYCGGVELSAVSPWTGLGGPATACCLSN